MKSMERAEARTRQTNINLLNRQMQMEADMKEL